MPFGGKKKNEGKKRSITKFIKTDTLIKDGINSSLFSEVLQNNKKSLNFYLLFTDASQKFTIVNLFKIKVIYIYIYIVLNVMF